MSFSYPAPPSQGGVYSTWGWVERGIEKSHRNALLNSLGLQEVLEDTLHRSGFSLLNELGIVTKEVYYTVYYTVQKKGLTLVDKGSTLNSAIY